MAWFFFLVEKRQRTRTDLNATVRWTVAGWVGAQSHIDSFEGLCLRLEKGKGLYFGDKYGIICL